MEASGVFTHSSDGVLDSVVNDRIGVLAEPNDVTRYSVPPGTTVAAVTPVVRTPSIIVE